MPDSSLTLRPEAAIAAKTQQNARMLFWSAVAAVVVAGVYYGITANVADPLLTAEGLVILFLATLPGLLWAKSGGAHLPLFEVFMLTTANTYAIPLLSGHDAMRLYSASLIAFAGFTVIAYQLAALICFYSVRVLPGRGPFYRNEILQESFHRYLGYGLWATTAYTYVSTFTTVIPNDLVSVFRAVFFGIGLVATFVQSQRWGLGILGRTDKIIFAFNFVLQLLILFSTLFLVGGLSLLVLALLGFVSGSRRLPLVPFVLIILGVGVLHNGKSSMREKYWDANGNHAQPALADLPGFFSEWLTFSFTTVPGKEDKATAARLLDRTSLFHLLCMVQSKTPEPLPYLNGSTYETLPAQFVPRFFWPDKPVGHAATYQMSVYYGLQRMEDTAKTTIGFGMLVEAYVNFGLFGAVLIGMLLGWFYKVVHGRAIRSPIISYAGLFSIVVMAWSFQTEVPLSMWLSSMYQACVAVLGVPFILRNFLR